MHPRVPQAGYSTLGTLEYPRQAAVPLQCGSVRGACSASLGVLRDALVDAPFLPVRRRPRADAARRQMPLARSVLAQMWSGPGADVAAVPAQFRQSRCRRRQSRCRCGSPGAAVGSPVQLAAVAPMQAACERERCNVGLHSCADRVTAHVVGRCADGRTPPVTAAHGGRGLAGPLPVRGVRRRRSPCRRRRPRGSRTVAPLPPPLPAGVHRMRRMRPTRRASLSAVPSRHTLFPV